MNDQVVIEGSAVEVPVDDAVEIQLPSTGDTPVKLSIYLASGHVERIDLDEFGWVKKHADYLRVRSIWALEYKDGSVPPLMLMVDDGDRPFYTARHIGVAAMGGDGTPVNEVVAYGIGKKHKVSGRWVTDRMWYVGGQMVAVGDDVDRLGQILVRGWVR